MPTSRILRRALPVVALSLATAATFERASLPAAEALRCRLAPGTTLALVHIERDTMLPFAPARRSMMSRSIFPASAGDSLLAMPGTPMPAARVRLLQVDTATRAALAAAGVDDDRPAAFIRAAPFRHDCRVVRWTGPKSFVAPGEEGYVRANLAPREQWIDGTPVFVVSESWNYPYPHGRGLARTAGGEAADASARAMFGVNLALEMPMARTRAEKVVIDSTKRERAIAWIKANPADAELEPVRSLLRRVVLDSDWAAASSAPSRLRGTWQVDVEADEERHTWFFRTHDRPGYSWMGPQQDISAAAVAASPWTRGYRLVGYPAGSPDSLPTAYPRGRPELVWLATDDRPTAPGNETQSTLTGTLAFTLGGAPIELWDHLDPFVPPPTSADSAFRARMGTPLPYERRQPRLPIILRLDERGGARADTTLIANGRRLHVVLTRIDTLSVKRPF